MPVQRVYSKNATYQMFEVLKQNRNKRHKQRAFLVEGVRNINHAIQYKWGIRGFLYPGDTVLSGWAQGLLSSTETEMNYMLAPALMREISGKADASEMLAIVDMRDDDPDALRLSPNPLVALFDRPSNRGNLGAVIRSCDALGVEALLLTGHGVDPYDPDVVVSTMGSFFALPVLRIAEHAGIQRFLSRMRQEYPGFQALGTTAHQQAALETRDLSRPTLLMIGNETDGLSQALSAMCDGMVTIPMARDASASSLNVACAASILFYEAGRQRRE